MEKGVGVAVCVEHGYIPTSPDELPLAVGERVVVLARSGTWLLGHAEAALPATAAWFPMVNVAPPPPPVHLHGYQHRRVKATSSARDAVGTGDVINLLPSDFSRVLGMLCGTCSGVALLVCEQQDDAFHMAASL